MKKESKEVVNYINTCIADEEHSQFLLRCVQARGIQKLLENRIDRAIEYLKEINNMTFITEFNTQHVIDILNGEDEDE